MTISNDRVTISSSVISDSFTDEAQRLISTTQSLHAVVSDSMTTVFTISNGVAEPSNQPTNLVFANVTSSAMDLSWTAATGAPTGYIVLRSTSAITDVPVDLATYNVGDTIGSCTVEFFGSGTSFTDSGLSAYTTYYYAIFSFNGAVGTYNYLTTSPLENSQATLYDFVNWLHFDGSNDYVNGVTVNLFGGASIFSGELYFKSDTFAWSNNKRLLSCEDVGVNKGWSVFGNNATKNVSVSIQNGSFAYGTVTCTDIQVENHIRWVYDGSQTGNANRLKIWLNGVLQSVSFTGTIPATIATQTAQTFTIGAFSSSKTLGLDGHLDDICLWSDGSANDMYNSGNGASPTLTNLVRWFKFDETDPSTTATDSAGVQDGTLVNFNFDVNSRRETHS